MWELPRIPARRDFRICQCFDTRRFQPLSHYSRRLRELLAGADGFQSTADPEADAHHLSNVLYNCMRGGVFPFDHRLQSGDLADFVAGANAAVLQRHRAWLSELDEWVDEVDLRDAADATGDPDLIRLVLEYLQLTFSRRHGDPCRPWNRLSISVRDAGGEPLLA